VWGGVLMWGVCVHRLDVVMVVCALCSEAMFVSVVEGV